MANKIHIGFLILSRKWMIRLGAALGCMLILFVLRVPLLRAMSNYLIVQDDLEPVEAIFVLSGNSLDRGQEAARLYQDGYAPKVICLGGERHTALELYEIDVLTSAITQKVLREAGVPDPDIELLSKGTSTYEEFEAIIQFCKEKDMHKIMVVSSLFHTRRIHSFFRLRLHFEGIQMVLRGASERSFDEDNWWTKEPGLIFLNNEYIKMAWYWLKY